MEPEPILEEIWQIKDRFSQDADYDIHRFFENLREWSEANPPAGRVIRNSAELRRLADEQEQKLVQGAASMLKEDSPSRAK